MYRHHLPEVDGQSLLAWSQVSLHLLAPPLPPSPPPRLRLKHTSISSNPALVGKNLLLAVVGLPKTLVYRCWGAWGREKKLLYYPEEVPYSCLCWFLNGPN